jgi:CD36 family
MHEGYLNLAPCYPEIGPPLAVSFPQSLHAADAVHTTAESSPPLLWGHSPNPDPARHQTYFDINMEIGAPLSVQVYKSISLVPILMI